mgnify:CR=1 FL=1|jgi:predicted transcriptional regulator
MNINALVQELWNLREQLRELSQTEKELRKKYAEVAATILTQLDTMGVNSLKTSVARVSITETQATKLTDWEAFTQYVKEYNAFHLLQKRPAANAVKELQTISGKLPPGIEIIQIRDIGLRTV